MSETILKSAAEVAARKQRPWRKAIVASSVVSCLASVVLIAGPAVLTSTPLFEQGLATAFQNFGLTTTTSATQGGWMKPVTFHGIELKDPQGRLIVRIKELQTSQGLLGFLTGNKNPGDFTFVGMDVEIHLDEQGHWPNLRSSATTHGDCSFRMVDSSVKVIAPWRELPIVDLDHLDLNGRVGPDETGARFLTVDPVVIVDHEPLSEGHTEQNLALIAPVLSQSTLVTGFASARLNEIRIPLDSTDHSSTDHSSSETNVKQNDRNQSPALVSGRVEFHTLVARLKPQWAVLLAGFAAHLPTANVACEIEVLQDTGVNFELRPDGVFHEGMVFLLPKMAPDLRIETSGMIHLDETLDLTVQFRLQDASPDASLAAASDKPSLVAQLLREPVSLSVAGTVKHPIMGGASGGTLLDEIAGRLAPGQSGKSPSTVSQAVFELIRGTGLQPGAEQQTASGTEQPGSAQQITGNVINLIRAIKAEKANQPEKPHRKKRKKDTVR